MDQPTPDRRMQRETGSRQTLDEIANWFLEQICIDPILTNGPRQQRVHHNAALRILAAYPAVIGANIHTAAVGARVQDVTRMLAETPGLAADRGGPLRFRYNKARESRWSPLLHLCYARMDALPADDVVAVATLLLQHGADPNGYFEGGSHPSRYTALTGLVGGGEENTPPHPHAAQLVPLLLKHGANPLDVQLLYNSALNQTVFQWFDLLYAKSVELDRVAEWSAPTWNADRKMSALDWLWHSARELGDTDRMVWLVDRGARGAVDQFDARKDASLINPAIASRFVAACFALDRPSVQQVLSQHPKLLRDCTALFAATAANRVDVVAMLLEVGVPIDVEDDPKQQALHIAASNDAFDVARYLLEHGANLEARESNWNNTPFDHALYGDHTEMMRLLANRSRNLFHLSVAGAVERIRDLLGAEPALAKVVEDSETPAMYLPDDESAAYETVRLLLVNGLDVSIVNSSGQTAPDLARKRGLFSAATLLESRT